MCTMLQAVAVAQLCEIQSPRQGKLSSNKQQRERRREQEDGKGTSPYHDPCCAAPPQPKEGPGCSRSADHRNRHWVVPAGTVLYLKMCQERSRVRRAWTQFTSQAVVISAPLWGAFLKACYNKAEIGNKDLISQEKYPGIAPQHQYGLRHAGTELDYLKMSPAPSSLILQLISPNLQPPLPSTREHYERCMPAYLIPGGLQAGSSKLPTQG